MTTMHPWARGATILLAISSLSVAVAACGDDNKLGPATPTGATEIGVPTVQSGPPPPPGWNPKDVVPQSQQQAQDMILGYLQRTIDAMPAGTELDATRYLSAGENNYCDDNDSSPNAPMRFHTLGDLKLAADTDNKVLVQLVGDIWRSWGWYVFESDGFRKPNQFGYTPDGYQLQIGVSAREGFTPSIQASSPCFPRGIADDDIPFPTVIKGV